MSETNAGAEEATVTKSAAGRGKMPDLPPGKEASLKAEYGEIVTVRTPIGAFAFKPPLQEDFERFADKISSDKAKKVPAARELCNLTLVCPSDATLLETLFARYPLLPVKIAGELQRLAGDDFEVEVKKG